MTIAFLVSPCFFPTYRVPAAYSFITELPTENQRADALREPLVESHLYFLCREIIAADSIRCARK